MTGADDRTTVHDAWTAVMAHCQAIGKNQRNTTPGQNYAFRGIDAVMSAVGPALRANGVAVLPVAEELTVERYKSKGDANMRGITLRVRFRIVGPAGDWMEGVTYGEAADSGDKAVSKAHSVAYRTFLLQALCVPTDEPDPDSQSHERAAPEPKRPEDPAAAVKRDIWQVAKARKLSGAELADDFRAWSENTSEIGSADLSLLTGYLTHLKGLKL